MQKSRKNLIIVFITAILIYLLNSYINLYYWYADVLFDLITFFIFFYLSLLLIVRLNKVNNAFVRFGGFIIIPFIASLSLIAGFMLIAFKHSFRESNNDIVYETSNKNFYLRSSDCGATCSFDFSLYEVINYGNIFTIKYTLYDGDYGHFVSLEGYEEREDKVKFEIKDNGSIKFIEANIN